MCCNRSEKEKFIIAKYVKKEFLAPKDNNQTESIDLVSYQFVNNGLGLSSFLKLIHTLCLLNPKGLLEIDVQL